ncbi:hypothetical protein NG816_25055 [Streptomyces sp. A13(2022)]|nr:hypothetical protein [Streptomyces sp. A13(2022)]
MEVAVGGEEHRVGRAVDGGRAVGGGAVAVRQEALFAALAGHHRQRGAEEPCGQRGQQVGAAVVAGPALGRGRVVVGPPGAGGQRLGGERAGQGEGGQRRPLRRRRPEGLREPAEGVELGLLLPGQRDARAVQFVLREGVGGVRGEGVEQVPVVRPAQLPGEPVAGGVDGVGGDPGVARGRGEPVGEVGAEQLRQPAAGVGGREQRVEERGAVVRYFVHLPHDGAVRRGEGAGAGAVGLGDRVRVGGLGAPSGLGVLLRHVPHRHGGRALVVGGEPGRGEVQPVVVRGGGVHPPLPQVHVVAGALPGADRRGLGEVPRQDGRQRGRQAGVAVAERAPLGSAEGEPGFPAPRAGVVVRLLGGGEVGGGLGHVVPGGGGLFGERGVVEQAVLAGLVLAQPDQGGGVGLGGARAASGLAEGAHGTAVGDPVVRLGDRQPAHRQREEHAAVDAVLDVGAGGDVVGLLGRDAVARAADRSGGAGVGQTGARGGDQRGGADRAFGVVGDPGLHGLGGLAPLHGLHAGRALHGEQPRAAAVHLGVEAGVGGVGLAEEACGGLGGQHGAVRAERLAEPGGETALRGGLLLRLRGRRAEGRERGVAGHAHLRGQGVAGVPPAEVAVAEAVGAGGGEGERVLDVGRAPEVDGEHAGPGAVVERQDVVAVGAPGGDGLLTCPVGRQHPYRALGFGHVLLGERAVGAGAGGGEQSRRDEFVERADVRDGTRRQQIAGGVGHGDGQGVAGDDLRVRLRGRHVGHRGAALGVGAGAGLLPGRRALE